MRTVVTHGSTLGGDLLHVAIPEFRQDKFTKVSPGHRLVALNICAAHTVSFW